MLFECNLYIKIFAGQNPDNVRGNLEIVLITIRSSHIILTHGGYDPPLVSAKNRGKGGVISKN